MNERNQKTDSPYCWCSKAALRIIRSEIDDFQSALTVYLALCELASDFQSQHFSTTWKYIMSKTGMSRSTVYRRLEDLERAGLLEIEQRKDEDGNLLPSLYRLLSCAPAQPARRANGEHKPANDSDDYGVVHDKHLLDDGTPEEPVPF